MNYEYTQDKETVGTTLEEECFQFASFENPLSFTEDDVDHFSHSNTCFETENLSYEQTLTTQINSSF